MNIAKVLRGMIINLRLDGRIVFFVNYKCRYRAYRSVNRPVSMRFGEFVEGIVYRLLGKANHVKCLLRLLH